MSNEPTIKRLLARHLERPATPGAEPDSDAGRMLAAVERMETAVRAAPDTVEQLRTGLAELAEVIARVRRAWDAPSQLGGDTDTLLQDIEARTQRMIELAGEATQTSERPLDEQAFLDAMGVGDTAAPQAEPDRVPTVSAVVSQFGHDGEADAEPAETTAASGRAVTTVSMLEAMVEELAASMAAAPPPAEPESQPATETSASRDPAALDDVELLSSFARMEAMPFLLPEVGTAVIFEARIKPEPAETEAAPAQEPPAAARTAIIHEPLLVMPPADPPDTEAASEPGEIDLDSLLFETPYAEHDPAAALLEPTSTESEPAAPEPANPAAAARSPAAWSVDLPSPAAAPKPSPKPDGPAPAMGADPLGPLRAMSDEEKIALFE